MQLYIVQQTPRMKRSVRILISQLLLHGAHLSSQRTSYERNYKAGSPPQIPPQITTSHARHTTRERHPGFSKAVFLNSGNRLLLSCGSMANVRSFCSPLLDTPLTPIFVAGSGKSVLWSVFPVIAACVHSYYRSALR
jgi:hypothetical protein